MYQIFFVFLFSACICLNSLQAAQQTMYVSIFDGFDDDGLHRNPRKIGEVNVFDFPKGSVIYMGIVRPLLECSDRGVMKTSLVVSDKGYLEDVKTGKFPSGFSFNEDDYIPGERLVCVVDNKNGDRREFQFFPRPLAAISKDESWAITVEALSWGKFQIEMIGVNKGESIKLNAISGNERIIKEFAYDPKILLQIEPAVVGKTGGISVARIERESGEYLEVEIPWGRELKKYLID